MTNQLRRIDIDALKRAIALYRAGSQWQRKTIDAMFARGDDWEHIGRYAAFHLQCEELGLPPWLVPPIDVHDIARDLVRTDDRAERTGLRAAAQLAQRMLTAGLSQCEPRPLQPLAAAEARMAAK